jgi:peptide/nickel transport system substrate-binding protein
MPGFNALVRGSALTRRRLAALLGATTALAGLPRPGVAADPGDRVRKLVLLSAPQSSDPQEFQAASLIAAIWKQLGLELEVRPMPRQQLSDLVWNQREKWDMTMWRMIGRPERSDPDELVSSLFNSQLVATGYDFIGYVNAGYDKVAEAQRQELDRDKRQILVREAQDLINHDQPYIFLVFPKNNYGFLNTVWKPESFVEQGGIGIRCFWSFLAAEPVGETKDMIVNSSESLVALNPLYIGGAVDSWAAELVWDRLMRIGPDGTATPWSAEKAEWRDNTTLDVTLRPGQMWHDGQPVTVDDVVFSFQAPAGTMAPMYKPFVTNIADVSALDDKVVRFKLKAPNAGFLVTSLGKVNLTPKHIWEPLLKDLAAKGQTAEQYQEPAPIGSGPFRLARFNLSEEVVLEGNTKHWRAPKMSRWIMRVVTNNDAALGMLRRGELNFLADYRGDPRLLLDLAKQDPSVSVVSTTDMGFRFLAPNERRPPFNDPQFRRALSAATNRPMLAAAAWQGFAVPANSMIAPSLSFWAKPGIDNVKFDISEAKKILADAGYSVVDGHLHYPPGMKETISGS